jgi:hypothetical protein
MEKRLAIGVGECPSMASEVVITTKRKRRNGEASPPTVIKLHRVLFSINVPKSDLLRFTSVVITPNSKSCLAYTLVDSGASHCFMDERFVWILGLIPTKSGTMIITTAKQLLGGDALQTGALNHNDERDIGQYGTDRLLVHRSLTTVVTMT